MSVILYIEDVDLNTKLQLSHRKIAVILYIEDVDLNCTESIQDCFVQRHPLH